MGRVVTSLEVVLLGLAAWRWARLVTVDEITRPLRTAVDHWARRPSRKTRKLASGLGFAVKDRDPDIAWHGKVLYLINCPHCVGVWTSAGVVAVWAWAPGLWGPLVVVPAVAGVVSVLALVLPPE